MLPTGMSCALAESPEIMTAIALHVLSLQSMGQLDRDVARFEAQVRITIVPPLCPLAASVFDFSQAASLIDRAARQTQAWLASGGMESSRGLHVPLLHHDRPKGEVRRSCLMCIRTVLRMIPIVKRLCSLMARLFQPRRSL